MGASPLLWVHRSYKNGLSALQPLLHLLNRLHYQPLDERLDGLTTPIRLSYEELVPLSSEVDGEGHGQRRFQS